MKRFMPRFYLPRAIDLITRAGSSYSPWLTFDLYKQVSLLSDNLKDSLPNFPLIDKKCGEIEVD